VRPKNNHEKSRQKRRKISGKSGKTIPSWFGGNASESAKKLVLIVLGPFGMALFPEPSLRAWFILARISIFYTFF
jgi:hypothetical protein